MTLTLVPGALVVVIVLGELTSMRSRPEAERKDGGSYFVFRGTLSVAYFIAFGLFGSGRMPASWALGSWVVALGVVCTVGGTLLRVWAMKTLGRYFTRVVHVSSDQKVVEDGPYRLLRHPSYTGGALASLGVGLAMCNALGVAILFGAFVAGMSYRIHVEERALLDTLGEPYREYMKRTRRLIPYVF